MKRMMCFVFSLVLLFSLSVPTWAAPEQTLQNSYTQTTLESAAVKVKTIKLNKSAVTLTAKGKTYQLKATISPSGASKKVKWTSSNAKIVSVSSTGKITAKASKGKATITCTAQDGSKKAVKCVVYIGKKVTSLTLTAPRSTIEKGDLSTLKASVKPTDAANKTILWSSSNQKVATVSSKGIVKAVGTGKVTITAKTQDGGKAKSVTITVKNKEKWKTDGMYKVGKDIPAGEYVVRCTSAIMCYIEVAKDSSGTLNSIITNDIFITHKYITLASGQYFTVDGGEFISVKNAPKFGAKNGVYPEGMYKVGRDISAGEYKVTSPKSGYGTYIEVARDSKGLIPKSIINNNFINPGTTAYVTVSSGNYLYVSGGTFKKV